MSTTTTPQSKNETSGDRNEREDHPTLEPEEARSATRGNGVWIILTVSTVLAVTVLLILFGGALG